MRVIINPSGEEKQREARPVCALCFVSNPSTDTLPIRTAAKWLADFLPPLIPAQSTLSLMYKN